MSDAPSPTETTALHLSAPAKVNLFLRVVGKRPDGFHDLETLFHAIDLSDDLYARRTAAPGVKLAVVEAAGSGMPVAAGEDNLVVRAARAHADACGGRGGQSGSAGVEFFLRKRIPAGGGLGGGSSDAAAALRLADALAPAPLGLDRLHEIAAGLGSDVPFFLRGGTQVGVGTGTELRPSAPLALHFVLCCPPFGTSTPEVYKNYRPHLPDGPTPSNLAALEAQYSQGISLDTVLRNDLAEAARAACPALDRSIGRVVDAGFPHVQVSGSGSTLFLAFARGADAAHAAEVLAPRLREESTAVIRCASATHGNPMPSAWPPDDASSER